MTKKTDNQENTENDYEVNNTEGMGAILWIVVSVLVGLFMLPIVLPAIVAILYVAAPFLVFIFLIVLAVEWFL